jgi:hypothetical protein
VEAILSLPLGTCMAVVGYFCFLSTMYSCCSKILKLRKFSNYFLHVMNWLPIFISCHVDIGYLPPDFIYPGL